MITGVRVRAGVAGTIVSVGGLALGGLVLGGCHASVSSTPPSVSKADLQNTVSETLTKQVGQKPDKIDCPGPIKAEKGQQTRCVLTAGGDRLGLTVTVTSVQGSDVKFNVQVDKKKMN